MRVSVRLRAALLTLAAVTPRGGEAAVAGRVLDAEGMPIAGATILAFEREGALEMDERRAAGRPRTPLATLTSAPDGSFQIDVKRPVAWVQANANGYAPELAAVDDTAPTFLTLKRAALRRGVVSATGRPVAGALVTWFSNDAAEWQARTTADGAFEAPDPGQAPGQLTVSHPDFAPLSVAVGGQAPGRGLDQNLEVGVALSGSVVDHATRKAVAGARVWIDETWPMAETDASGAFRIAHAPREWTNVTARTGAAIGAAKRKSGPLVISIKPSRTLTGTVRDASDNRPLAGATVVVTTSGDATLTAETDTRGQYTLSGLPAERYTPYAGRPGYASGPRSGLTPIDLRRALSARFDVALTALRRVQGRVEDEGLRPVQGALVSLGFKDTPNVYSREAWSNLGAASGNAEAAWTAADGTFTLALPPDDETPANMPFMKERPLIVLKQGFAAAQARLEAGAARPASVVVTLTRGIELSGRVIGPSGEPIGGVGVTAAEDGALGGSIMPTHLMLAAMKQEGWTRSDDAGRFAIRVHPTLHHVAFRKAGYAPKLARGHDPRSRQPLDVVLEPAAIVRGRVSRPDGRGVPDVMIAVASPMGMDSENTTTSADGGFEVANLAPGVYRLRAYHEELGIDESRTLEAPITNLEIVLGAAVTLRGQVIDAASRQPVPRFNVAVESKGESGSSSRAVEAEDPGGTFAVPDVSVGEAEVTVSAEGYVARELEGLSLEAEVDPPELKVLLEADVAIRGRVTGEGSAPIADASVRVLNPKDLRLPGAVADEDGEYELRGAPPGELTLSFEADGFVSEKRTIDSRQSTRLDVALKRGLTLKGEVVKAGAGVANAWVGAHSSTQGAASQTAQTDERGRFAIEGLVPGRYTVTARVSGGGSAKLHDVDVETAGLLRLVLDKTATAVLRGRVAGLPEDGEAGMTMVMATNEESGESSQVSIDKSHSFRMEEAPSGRVKVRGFAASFPGGSVRTSRTVELVLAPGSETETVLEFANDITISGSVVRDGVGVPLVMVAFSSDDLGSSTQTDARGAYEVVGLEPGLHQVRVVGDNVSFKTEYQVSETAEFNIDITGGAVAGRVVRADGGEAVSGVEVSFFRIGGNENTPASSVTSGNQGSFSQRSLHEGRYRLVTSKAGFGQEVREVEVSRAGTAEVLLELTPAEGVSLTVVDARDSRPLEAIVVVRDQAKRIVANRHSGVGEDGALNIPLAKGAYSLSTSASGYGTVTQPVTAPTRGLRVGLTPGGTLVIESARGLRGKVRLVQPDGEEYVRCWCNGIAEIELKGRRTSVENVTPGSYTLDLVDVPGGAASRPVVIREGQTSTVTID